MYSTHPEQALQILTGALAFEDKDNRGRIK